ncbi:MAG TPA: TolC family protein [Thermoanaerobaculia bacterium]|nr:TolC family protein [Thermoanaerobaculia bacterium]
MAPVLEPAQNFGGGLVKLVVPKAALVVVVLATAVAPVPVRATESPVQAAEDPLLASLIEEGLAQNPGVIAAREGLTAARSRPDQARSLANPMLSLNYTNDGWSPSLGSQSMTTLAFMGSQDLPYPGKRQLRGDIASREAEQSEQQLQRVRLAIAANIKRAYYGLILGRELLDVTRDQAEIWTQTEAIARGRYALGQGAQQDVLRVQIEVTRIEELRAEQQAEVEIRLAELNRLLNRPVSTPQEAPASLTLRPVTERLDELVRRLGGISPEAKSAGVGIAKAGLSVALARKEFKPDFSVQAGYMNRGGLDPMWQAGVGVSVPLYRRRLASGLAEAEAQLRASERLAEAVKLQLRFRTQERFAQLQAEERIAEFYGQGVVPQDQMSVEAAVANYQTGKVPFIAVLEAVTTLYNDRARYLRVVASHESTRASLEEGSLEGTSQMTSVGAGGMQPVGASAPGMATGATAGGASMGGAGSTGNR